MHIKVMGMIHGHSIKTKGHAASDNKKKPETQEIEVSLPIFWHTPYCNSKVCDILEVMKLKVLQ